MRGYKGFDRDMRCGGVQFAVGETVEGWDSHMRQAMTLLLCYSPLELLRRYPPADGRRYAEVEYEYRVDDGGRPGQERLLRRMRVVRELSVADLVRLAGQGHCASNSGDQAAATADGESCIAAVAGPHALSLASGESGLSAGAGYGVRCIVSGDNARAAAAGHQALAMADGEDCRAVSTGYEAAASCGKDGAACVVGPYGRLRGAEGAVLAGVYFSDGRWRIAMAYVGENGIKPGVWYKVDALSGQFVECEPDETPI